MAQLQAQSRGCKFAPGFKEPVGQGCWSSSASHGPGPEYTELYNALSLLCGAGLPGHRKQHLQCKEQARVTLQMLCMGHLEGHI